VYSRRKAHICSQQPHTSKWTRRGGHTRHQRINRSMGGYLDEQCVRAHGGGGGGVERRSVVQMFHNAQPLPASEGFAAS
jgi:hypothetical protein